VIANPLTLSPPHIVTSSLVVKMSQSLVFTLLALAFGLPLLGAIVLRVLTPRLAPPQLYGAAALIFGVAVISVLLLARANVSSLQIGELSLLLPAAAPADVQPATDQRPTTNVPPAAALPTNMPTAAPSQIEPTEAPTMTPTVTSPTTVAPTETPTVVPPTAEPPTAVPPTQPPKPSGRRTYIVKPGDTLRGIAEQFNVTVAALLEANKLTPQAADSLKIGQELVIP
jgi:LysM repeat protein